MSTVRFALLFVLCWCSQLSQTVELKYALFTSTRVFDSSGAVPAIELAEQMVNSNDSVLPGYTLSHTGVRDTMCMRTRSLNLYFEATAAPNPPFLGLIGCGCSVATTPVAEIVQHESLSQISYGSSSIELDQRERFPNFFRTQPSDVEFTPIFTELIQLYGWQRVAFLNQNEGLFTETFDRLVDPLAELNISTKSTLIPQSGPIDFDQDFFFDDEDYRIFFVNTYSDRAQYIICEALKRGYTFPRYTFIFYGWYVDNWWTQKQNPSSINCTDSELADFLHRHISINVFAVTTDENAMTDTGLTAKEFNTMYLNTSSPYTLSYVGTIAYDALWTLAFALDNTNRMIVNMTREEILNTTGCVGVNPLTNISWDLVSLENFTYDNELMGCVIRWNLQRTDFKGVSGKVQFNEVGGRFQAHSQIFQYRSTESSVQPDFIALTALKDNRTVIEYVNNESNATVFPESEGGIPPDGTPINQINTFHLALVVIYYILAILGVLFSTACLIFNITQRNKKVVRLTSPNINYFLIAGTYIMYISVFLRLLPSVDFGVNYARCIFEAMVDIIGYSLAFGVILVKMGRIYYIFNNPTSYKTTIKDWHLIVISVSIALFGGLLAFVQVAVPEFRPIPEKINNEVLGTSENTDGVKIIHMVYRCGSPEQNSWIIVIFLYLALLQVVGIVLAIQTRKVKVKILNDSKYIAALIYISSIVLVTRAVAVFAVPNLLDVREAIFSGGIIIISTAFLSLVFIPKMVDLINDPQGEKIFDRHGETELTTSLGFTRRQSAATVSEQQARINQLEEKVSELEMKLREQESVVILGEETNGKLEHETLSLDILSNNGFLTDSEHGSRPPTGIGYEDKRGSIEVRHINSDNGKCSKELINGHRVTICEPGDELEHEQQKD